MRTANPALNDKTFSRFEALPAAADTMTIQGTVNKIFIMLGVALLSAGWVWKKFFDIVRVEQDYALAAQATYPWLIGGLIGGLVFAIITSFKPNIAYVTGLIYVALEGLFLGGISAFMEARFPGIVIQAVGLTFGTLFCLLLVYKLRLVKVTENFKMGVMAATGGIMMIYLVTFLLRLFIPSINLSYIHGSGIISIGFSFFVVIIAALNLVLDFDFIEKASERRAPKYMEWYAAFGLMVTLVWLYIEILRLLSKLNRSD